MQPEKFVDRAINEKLVVGNPQCVPFRIFQRVSRGVCKLELPDDVLATGFFCILEIGSQCYYGLCTNNHVIDFSFITSGNAVKCVSDDGQTVQLQISSYTFSDEELDATFIEVRNFQVEQIKAAGFQFLRTDNEVIENETVCVGEHPFGQELFIVQGVVEKLTECGIYHTASTERGSSGAPVANAQGNVIGIHRGADPKENRNVAVKISALCKAIEQDVARTAPACTLSQTDGNRNVQNVCSAMCLVKIPNGIHGFGCLCTFTKDGVAHYGLVTTEKILDVSYLKAYRSLSCLFETSLLAVQISTSSFKTIVRGLVYIDVDDDQRRQMVLKNLTFLSLAPELSDDLFIYRNNTEEDFPVKLTDQFNDGDFLYLAASDFSPGCPIVNVQGQLVGLHKARNDRHQNRAVRISALCEIIVAEKHSFTSHSHRRGRVHMSSVNQPLSDAFQNPGDMLNNCVCKIEGKGGSSVGFFCCIWSPVCGHVYGLFTSNQFISKHYLKGHRYLRCVIADQVNYIPTNRYTFSCPILGVTFIEIMNCSKSVKRVDTNLSAVSYLTASRNDCIEICAIQFQPELHGAVTSRGRVSDNRGVHFAHSLNSKYRSSGAPICDMEGYVVGIQKALRCANGVNYAVTMRYVCDAILSDRMRSDQLPFEQWRIPKLALHGLVQSKKKPKNMVLEKNMLFEFYVASEARPYWFCRSHYWYWSPNEPVGDGSEDDVIWMRVSPYDDMSITGGRLNGQEAPDECKTVIRFLQKEGHKYM